MKKRQLNVKRSALALVFLAGISMQFSSCTRITGAELAFDATEPEAKLSILKISKNHDTEIITIKNDTCIVIPKDVNFEILGAGSDEEGLKINNLTVFAYCSNGILGDRQISTGTNPNASGKVPQFLLTNINFNQELIEDFQQECNANSIQCYRIRCNVRNLSGMAVNSPILKLIPESSSCNICF